MVQSASFYLWAFARLVVEEPSVLHDATLRCGGMSRKLKRGDVAGAGGGGCVGGCMVVVVGKHQCLIFVFLVEWLISNHLTATSLFFASLSNVNQG